MPAPARPFVPGKIELPLHRRVDRSFLDYASYVIRDRAIPNLADGLKPVQRRILWALHEKDDGRFIKVANVVGHAMQYHPHGDASIGDALVVLANKRYLIEGQGNFGNIFTGDLAAAPRYIECRLTELARTEVFNDEITEFVPSYDGRNKEPVTLPSKLPLLLMLGTEGIAVGMSSRILPHNFPELLEAQIAILKKQPFKCLPDFQTGGLMDARDYKDGAGEIKVRAKIKVKDESTVVIKEIPPTTTTDSLIGSIEDASRKGKIKVKSINDFTSEEVEIEVKAPERRQRGAVGGCALCLHRLRSHHRQPHRRHPEQPAGRDDRVRGPAREHGPTGGDPQARTGAQGSASSRTNCISAPWSASSSRSASTRRSSSARPTKPSWPPCTRASSRSAGSWFAS